MSQWREGVRLLHEVSFDGKPPETCLELFEAERFEGCVAFVGLTQRIQKADHKWIEEFLGQGGLEKLFETLAILSGKALVGFADAVPELECARCIKSIMNHQLGMEHIIKTEKNFIHKLTEGKHSLEYRLIYEVIRKLFLGLSSDSELMKIEVFQLLSAVCMYSPEGHKLVIDACGLNYSKVWLQHFKNNTSIYSFLQRTRASYRLLVEELRAAKTDEYRATIVAFINCLLARCNDVEERLKIRHGLTGVVHDTV